uniref:Uncharacterized protein n=1 Tax=Parascaris equorum TaxID=6256 RepID=A0A914SJR6_PAREQ
MKKDIFGVSDPYAIVALHRNGVLVDKAQTKTRKKVGVVFSFVQGAHK